MNLDLIEEIVNKKTKQKNRIEDICRRLENKALLTKIKDQNCKLEDENKELKMNIRFLVYLLKKIKENKLKQLEQIKQSKNDAFEAFEQSVKKKKKKNSKKYEKHEKQSNEGYEALLKIVNV